jgi:hypothetical protein
MTLRKDVKKTLDKTVQRVSTTELVALHFVTFSFFLRIAFFSLPFHHFRQQNRETKANSIFRY